jgi:hypothetical protein
MREREREREREKKKQLFFRPGFLLLTLNPVLIIKRVSQNNSSFPLLLTL